jgi:hypothetical protein
MSTICTHTASITLTELPEVIAGCAEVLCVGRSWQRTPAVNAVRRVPSP